MHLIPPCPCLMWEGPYTLTWNKSLILLLQKEEIGVWKETLLVSFLSPKWLSNMCLQKQFWNTGLLALKIVSLKVEIWQCPMSLIVLRLSYRSSTLSSTRTMQNGWKFGLKPIKNYWFQRIVHILGELLNSLIPFCSRSTVPTPSFLEIFHQCQNKTWAPNLGLFHS